MLEREPAWHIKHNEDSNPVSAKDARLLQYWIHLSYSQIQNFNKQDPVRCTETRGSHQYTTIIVTNSKWPSASSQLTKLTYQPLLSAIYNIGTNWCDLYFINQGMGTYKLSSDWGSNKFTTNTVRCSIEGQALIPANKTSFRPLKPDNSFKYWDKSWIVKFNIHSTGPF